MKKILIIAALSLLVIPTVAREVSSTPYASKSAIVTETLDKSFVKEYLSDKTKWKSKYTAKVKSKSKRY